MDLYEKLAQKRQLERMILQAKNEIAVLENKKRQYQNMNKKIQNAMIYLKSAKGFVNNSSSDLANAYQGSGAKIGINNLNSVSSNIDNECTSLTNCLELSNTKIQEINIKIRSKQENIVSLQYQIEILM